MATAASHSDRQKPDTFEARLLTGFLISACHTAAPQGWVSGCEGHGHAAFETVDASLALAGFVQRADAGPRRAGQGAGRLGSAGRGDGQAAAAQPAGAGVDRPQPAGDRRFGAVSVVPVQGRAGAVDGPEPRYPATTLADDGLAVCPSGVVLHRASAALAGKRAGGHEQHAGSER